MENRFKYPLNTQVWFQYEGNNYTANIYMRGAMEHFHPANAENPKDEVVVYNSYAVQFKTRIALVKLVFNESDFGKKVFADKVEFVDKILIIS